jgi:PBP1b-binding outer membrane lipoprotein LpoB
MYFVKMSAVIASALVLSGCSFSLPSEADKEPCQQLNTVLSDKLSSLATGGFDAALLAAAIQTDVIAIAPESFKPVLEKVNGALIADPIATGDLTAAATEIGMRCALVGVNVDFPDPQDLLLN